MATMITAETTQEEYLQILTEVASRLGLGDAGHYTTNADHYWKNKGQFISVINKQLPDDKLKVIFQSHIQRIANPVQGKEQKDASDLYGGDEHYPYRNEKRIVYENMVKLVPTTRFSTFNLIGSL